MTGVVFSKIFCNERGDFWGASSFSETTLEPFQQWGLGLGCPISKLGPWRHLMRWSQHTKWHILLYLVTPATKKKRYDRGCFFKNFLQRTRGLLGCFQLSECHFGTFSANGQEFGLCNLQPWTLTAVHEMKQTQKMPYFVSFTLN